MATTARSGRRAGAEIVYPESDGKPMADNTLQFRWIVTIKEGLDAQFAAEPRVFVAGDLLWYPVEGQPKIRIAPDALVAFGRPKGDRGSYLQWHEENVPPQVVFEVLSPGNRAGEMKRKFAFYEQYGVEEYYLYDPDSGRLWGWLRDGARLKPVAAMSGHVSPRLGIRFEPGEGPDNLTIIDRNGDPFLPPLELYHQRDRARLAERTSAAERRRAETAEQTTAAERRRAETAEHRAETAEHRAEAAEQASAAERERAERYAAKLRALGIEQD